MHRHVFGPTELRPTVRPARIVALEARRRARLESLRPREVAAD
jgi:hypothetical protein